MVTFLFLLIMKLLSLFFAFFILFNVSCKKKAGDYVINSIKHIEIKTDSGNYDADLLKYIYPFKKQKDELNDAFIIFSEKKVEKSLPNGLLNNLVADILFNEMQLIDSINVDFCVLNYGGLRSSLPKGEINVSNIFQLMPFDNEVAIVKMNYEQIVEMFNYMLKVNGQPVSNIKIEYQEGVFKYAYINNVMLDKKKEYYCVTSDFLSNGGDNMSFFVKSDSVKYIPYKIRDAIINNLKNMANEYPYLVVDTNRRIIIE